jgi:molybdopterin/thiamine biosynthesis adenylyltransferase
MSFSKSEVERYARHIMLKELGGPGQQKLKAARVAIVGAGGLGAPAALYLAAAGVGRMRLIDDDTVSLSNLQRQVLFRTADLGAAKVDVAAKELAALNPEIEVDPVAVRLTPDNAQALLTDFDLILDGTDDFATRFAVNAAAHTLGVTLVSGAVGRWDGQLATYKSGHTKGRPLAERLPCYRCLVPEIPPDAETCAAVGVVGALTGVIGAHMALEAVKELSGAGEGLAGRLYLFDSLHGQARIVRLSADPACPVCGDKGGHDHAR